MEDDVKKMLNRIVIKLDGKDYELKTYMAAPKSCGKGVRDQLQRQGAVVGKLSKLRQEQEKVIKKQNANIERLTRLFEEQHQAKRLAAILTTPDIKAVVEAKVLSAIETKVAALVDPQLTVTVEQQRTAAVESTLEALVVSKLEPISSQIGDTFTILTHRIDTHTPLIDDVKAQLTHFVAHVKSTCIHNADLEDCYGRKKHAHREESFSILFARKRAASQPSSPLRLDNTFIQIGPVLATRGTSFTPGYNAAPLRALSPAMAATSVVTGYDPTSSQMLSMEI
ncbi:hypothetical protein HPB51_001464 [Rhipicephalus microplus]|uniref:Uncharacterized protein n=1 Tax=Rhipicephalus microplus TaxID=6941 RepID=A0A9J6DRM2_RHIMP|nr:hypothetical protein HPB51_001464 [Rhipicephalus microplus]